MKYVFDLDNTLIYSDNLNNESYNYALKQFGLSEVWGSERVTRRTVAILHPKLSVEQLEKIISVKQQYFAAHLEKTKINDKLSNLLKSVNSENCVLWTSAQDRRVFELLNYYKLSDSFAFKIFSDKSNLQMDVALICRSLDCNPAELIFFDNDSHMRERLEQLNMNLYTLKEKDTN